MFDVVFSVPQLKFCWFNLNLQYMTYQVSIRHFSIVFLPRSFPPVLLNY